jgi:hypothetical protein
MERKSEIYVERQWELYRRSVAERMPDSDYKAAVLAGIAHTIMRLDSIETSRRRLGTLESGEGMASVRGFM